MVYNWDWSGHRINHCLVKVTKDMCAQGCSTFESFLVKDDCVVLWCLRQTEKLASERGEEEQMKRGKRLEIEKT